jgi:membrane protein YqaA with SNARE-associated domain
MMAKRVTRWIVYLERFTDRVWYRPVMALLAGLDMVIIVVPVDGILVTTCMLQPKKWVRTFLWFAAGSALGAVFAAELIHYFGDAAIERIAGDNIGSETWRKLTVFIENHGPWALALVAVGPIPLQIGVVIAAAAKMPMMPYFAAILIGRLIKYGFLSWVATHAPGFLGKLWGIKGELKDIAAAEKEVFRDSGTRSP